MLVCTPDPRLPVLPTSLRQPNMAACICSSAALTALLSRDLDAVRAFVYANVCGNRGLRGLAEVR